MIKILKNKGIATLPTVIVLGMMALAVAVSITSLALNELFISQGSAQSASALFYAESGARDALVKIARNKNYTCAINDCSIIDFVTDGYTNGSGYAEVLVSGDGTTATPKIITSKGVMKASTRTIQVEVILDAGVATKGEITSAVWKEITI